MRETPAVVVLGAGPAGLAAGCHLAARGIATFVVEQEPHVGGLCHTLSHAGFRFDIGGHRWFTKNHEVDRWVKQLMGDEFLRVRRFSRIYFRGTYVSYPVTVRNVLHSVGLVAAAEAVISYLAAQFGFRAPPRTMEDAYVRQFGRRLYEMFFETYSEKVWGRPCSELSPDWVGQRTRGLSVSSAVRGALARSARQVESLVEEFYYPRTGYGRISERMAERLMADGGTLALRTRVVGIVTRDGQVTGVRLQSGAEASRVLSADAVISTVPLPLCVRLLEATVPQHVRDAAAGLRFRDLITVTVFLERERVGNDTWLYVHDPEIPFARIHEPRNWSSAMAPSGKTSLVVEYFVDCGDATWGKSDSELGDMTVDHLSRGLDLIRRKEVQGCHVFRARNAYPIYGLDYGARLREVKEYLSGFSNLQLIGRGGAFRYNNSDHSIEMGIAAAKNLLGDRQDLDLVNSAEEYLEERRLPGPSDLTPGRPVTRRPLA